METLDRWIKYIESEQLNEVYDDLYTQYGYEAVRVFSVHGTTIEIVYAKGRSEEDPESIAVMAKPWDGVMGAAFENREILQVPEYAAHPRAIPKCSEYVRSMLVMPLQHAGEDLGAITLLTYDRVHPGLSDDQLAELRFLRVVLSALAAAHRLRVLQERQRGLVAFMDAVHRIDRLDDLVDLLFDRLAEDVGADAVGINFVEGSSLRLVFGVGNETDNESRIIREVIVPYERDTLTYQVLAKGEPLLVGDATDNDAMRRHPSRVVKTDTDEGCCQKLRSYLAVPFKNATTQGVISLQSRNPWQYGVEDVAHITTLSEVLGYAIERLRWRGLERFARRLGRLHEWHTTDEREVYTELLRAVSEVWPLRGAACYLREHETSYRKVAAMGDQTLSPGSLDAVEQHLDRPIVFPAQPKLPDVLKPLWSSEEVHGALLLPFGDGFVWLESASGFTDWDLRMARSMQSEIRTLVERMGLHTRLAREAAIDPLTGIYNRRSLEQQLARLVSHAAHHGHRFTVAVVDMANFRTINNRYGHLAGDRVLARVAKVLKQSLREGDEVYRLGGDEFVLVLPESGREAAVHAIHRVAEALKHDPDLQHYEVHANFGIAVYRQGDAPEDLLERADREMFAAKKRGLVVLDEPLGA